MNSFFLSAFKGSFVDTIEFMAGIKVSNEVRFTDSTNEFDSSSRAGVVSIVGFSGKLKGRALLWAPAVLAQRVTELVIDETAASYQDETVLFTINEINNVLCGQATTQINNRFNLSLRLSPPSVFAGESFVLTTPKLKTFQAELFIGQDHLILNIALEGGLPDE